MGYGRDFGYGDLAGQVRLDACSGQRRTRVNLKVFKEPEINI